MANDQQAYLRKLEIIDAFTRHDGWKMFDYAMSMAERQAFNDSLNAKNPHDMAKHLGAFKAIRDMRTWPAREAMATRAALGKDEQY